MQYHCFHPPASTLSDFLSPNLTQLSEYVIAHTLSVSAHAINERPCCCLWVTLGKSIHEMACIIFHSRSTKYPVAWRRRFRINFYPEKAYHFTPPQRVEDKSKQVGQAERRWHFWGGRQPSFCQDQSEVAVPPGLSINNSLSLAGDNPKVAIMNKVGIMHAKPFSLLWCNFLWKATFEFDNRRFQHYKPCTTTVGCRNVLSQYQMLFPGRGMSTFSVGSRGVHMAHTVISTF